MADPKDSDYHGNVEQPEREASFAASDCSAIQMAFTQEELQNRAKKYVTWLYGNPGQGNDADKWMERFGLLCGFIDEQFSPNGAGELRLDVVAGLMQKNGTPTFPDSATNQPIG